jgi:hypothetical protein
MSPLERFIVVVEGLPLEEIEEIELLLPPAEGEPIETRYGTCIVTRTEGAAEGGQYAGRIFCRMP